MLILKFNLQNIYRLKQDMEKIFHIQITMETVQTEIDNNFLYKFAWITINSRL